MTRAKRAFDLVGAGLGVLLLAPLLAVLALLVKAEDGGPVLFKQERVGYRGRRFRIWKFRTMVPDAESLGPFVTPERDPRVTRIGAWLRRRKLDELPQLFNVLAGDMSLVGPRPDVPSYVARYHARERRVLELVPGMTDEAAICFLGEGSMLAASRDPERNYLEEIAPEKIRLSLEYAARASVWTDLKVILGTLRHLYWGSTAARLTPTTDRADPPFRPRAAEPMRRPKAGVL
ncbi:MAG TPA: sugar transferase [Gemmatimonadales bacterium]|nr:sugar transferase [Gemmatimonadales bacterium]